MHEGPNAARGMVCRNSCIEIDRKGSAQSVGGRYTAAAARRLQVQAAPTSAGPAAG